MPKTPEYNDQGWRLYYKDRPTTLYYIKFTYQGSHYYKIGITTQTVEKRFVSEPVPYKVIWTKTFSGGLEAYVKEQKILKDNAKHRYYGPSILLSGNSELMVKDIMKGKK